MLETDPMATGYMAVSANILEPVSGPDAPVVRRKVQFVIKTSKFCNLRCRYCYEFPDLGDRAAIAPAQLERMYRTVADHYYSQKEDTAIQFVWDGGEPLLIDPDFYWQTFDAQTRIFGDPKVKTTNVVQTNLTILNDRLIKLLAEGFDGVGVSMDLFSGLRVNAAGRNLEPTVLKNMDRLNDAGIAFGCITVLGRQNRPHLANIFRFFAESSISTRILPLHLGAAETQNDADSLPEDEVAQAYKELFDMWIESAALIIIEPINSYMKKVISALAGHTQQYYDKRTYECIYIVNTDGNLFSYADIYELSRSHGNIIDESMRDLVGGAGRLRAIEAAEARVAATCASCRHYGRACGGYPIAEELPERRDSKMGSGLAACIRERGILDYIEQRLLQLGVVDLSGKLNRRSPYFERIKAMLRALA